MSPLGPPWPHVPGAGDSITQGRRHLTPLSPALSREDMRWWLRPWSVACPHPHWGRSPRVCPGSTHVEDGEEHQDGDLEHADLDGNAVPNLDAGEDRGTSELARARSPAALGLRTNQARGTKQWSPTWFWSHFLGGFKFSQGQADKDVSHQCHGAGQPITSTKTQLWDGDRDHAGGGHPKTHPLSHLTSSSSCSAGRTGCR